MPAGATMCLTGRCRGPLDIVRRLRGRGVGPQDLRAPIRRHSDSDLHSAVTPSASPPNATDSECTREPRAECCSDGLCGALPGTCHQWLLVSWPVATGPCDSRPGSPLAACHGAGAPRAGAGHLISWKWQVAGSRDVLPSRRGAARSRVFRRPSPVDAGSRKPGPAGARWRSTGAGAGRPGVHEC